MDFALPPRSIHASLLAGRGHYDTVMRAVQDAETSVWIATANLKQLMIEGARGRYRSILEVFDRLAGKGVELRILHAAFPSRPFRESFDSLSRLVAGGLQLRQCPRVHLKAVIIDGARLYFGSANWTGAGLGVKHEGRRNFELGLWTEDEDTIDAVQELYERIWRGSECRDCRLRDQCEAPLDLLSGR